MSREKCEFTAECRCTSCLNELADMERDDFGDGAICRGCDRFHDDCLCEVDQTDLDCDLCAESGLSRCICYDVVPDEFDDDETCDLDDEVIT